MRGFCLLGAVLSVWVVEVTSSSACQSNHWVTLPGLPKATGEVAGAILGNAMYVAGENNTDTFKFDFGSNKWSQVASRIHPGNHHAAEVVDGEWWLIGGIDNDAYGTVQIYNPKTDQWKLGTPLPWDGGSVCAAYINGTLYVCGGIIGFNGGKDKGGTKTTGECAQHHPNTHEGWTSIASMPAGRNHAAVTTDGARMWVFGGRIGRNTPTDGYDDVQVYDPDTNTWKTSAHGDFNPLPQRRGGTGHAVFTGGDFYVFGGETRDDSVNATKNWVYPRVDIYNRDTNKWRRGADMPVPRHGIFPLYHDGAIHIAGGGLHHGYSTTVWYDKYCV